MCKPAWIGVDLGKETFSAAIAVVGTRPADWASLPVEQFTHDKPGVTAFVRWVKRQSLEQALGVFFLHLIAGVAAGCPPARHGHHHGNGYGEHQQQKHGQREPGP